VKTDVVRDADDRTPFGTRRRGEQFERRLACGTDFALREIFIPFLHYANFFGRFFTPAVRISVTTEEREALRRRYLPARVRVLFVAESPPAGGNFFYSGDSMLFRETREAFCVALGEHLRDGFLECFTQFGCYLDDLCTEPVNRQEPKARRTAHRAGVSHLARTFARLRPRAIAVLLKSIEKSVADAAIAAGCECIERHVLTYPSRWHSHRAAYRGQLAALLRDFSGRGVLMNSRSGLERQSLRRSRRESERR
jgi:hypothetical protein